MRVGLLVVGWLIVAVLGLVALLRLVAWDSIEPLIVLDALTLIVYLPAWVVAVGALIARRWWLAAAAAVIVAAQLAFVVPELLAAAPVPAWARHAPVVRVFDANIDKSLHFEAGYVRAIEQDRPDLITLEEFTPPALQSMVASGVLASFPYRCAAPAYGATGFLIASRLRLTGCQVRTVFWDGCGRRTWSRPPCGRQVGRLPCALCTPWRRSPRPGGSGRRRWPLSAGPCAPAATVAC